MANDYTITKLNQIIEKKLSHNFCITPDQVSDKLYYKVSVLILLEIMKERKAKFSKKVDEVGAKYRLLSQYGIFNGSFS